MNKCAYSKTENQSIERGYVSYYQYSNNISFNFTVHYDNDGNVDSILRMDKRISKEGRYYVSDSNGNITEEEFNQALNKTIDFISKGSLINN